mmetsp:Transcript_44107/g.80541  ORF Transcript_44107/g.80541 Transcript_44107/m.80541 type:complete len:140 (-) Transcript_44107:66-485(-)
MTEQPAAETEGEASVQGLVSNPGVSEIKADVVQHLEDGGALGKLKALMRANVYKALLTSEEEATPSDAPMQVVSIVADFLDHAGLDLTKEIFLRESALVPISRAELEQSMSGCSGIPEPLDAEKSVLAQVLESVKKRPA